MLIGSLNSPKKDLLKEVRWVARNFDFLDLTLELPKAYPDSVNTRAVKKILQEKSLPVVGHTAWYLPIGSPFAELRMYALQELEKCAAVLGRLGAEKMNVHPDPSLFIIKERHIIDFNIWSLRRLVSIGNRHGVKIMMENTPGLFSRPEVIGHILRKVPRLLLHLDVAHAFIGKDNSLGLVRKFSEKIAHVHVSDNRGKQDEHLPLGKGSIKWPSVLGALKKSGYDGTITLEVFTSPQDRLADKSKLRKIWDCL